MPVHVDREKRRSDLIDAAMVELGENGLRDFALKRVGARLGGSVTLVTHYFSSKQELFKAMLDQMLDSAEKWRVEIVAESDPGVRIARMLEYFIPETDNEVAVERARLALSTHGASDPEIRAIFDRLDPGMHSVIEAGLSGAVPEHRLSAASDMVRIWTSGLVLLVVEHPLAWPADRRAAAVTELTGAIRTMF